jgi:hypothetical protein
MVRPSKLTNEIQQRIGENIALGSIYIYIYRNHLREIAFCSFKVKTVKYGKI